MDRNVTEILGSGNELLRNLGSNWQNTLRCACPGIIQSFNAQTQTCTVQLAIREEITNTDYSTSWVQLPLLTDVPILIPRAGGYSLTFPIKNGDECLVIFSDMCIDGWFGLGGIQNQPEKRRHDLSDAIAIVGLYSQPNVLENYSMDSMQLRSNSGSSYISFKENEIDIVSNSVKINGIGFDQHTHNAPSGGGQTSGPS